MNHELYERITTALRESDRVQFFDVTEDQWFRMRTTPTVVGDTYETIAILSRSTYEMLMTKLLSQGLVDSLNQIKALFVINNGEEVDREELTLDVHLIANNGDMIKPFYYDYDEELWFEDGSGEGDACIVANGQITDTFTLSQALAFEVMDQAYLEDDGVFNFGSEDEHDGTAQNDWDFGGLEDGTDPDSVAVADYDFNVL